jgi:broad specificity phosphatase PhoE
MTNIYFIRHAESCSNISPLGRHVQPPLSYKGIQQAVYLGIDNKIIDKDFEEYYCSPSLRTIMTACLALRKKTKKIILKLNSNLIENKNFADYGRQFGLFEDQQNAVVKPENLKKMIDYIKLWFQNKYFDNFIDYEFIDLIYDLVLLLYINNSLSKPMYALLFNNEDSTRTRTQQLNDIIQLISAPEYNNFESSLIYITKSESKLSYNNNKYDIISFLNGDDFEICIHHSSKKKIKMPVIIESLKKFLDKNYYFNNNIEFNYSYGPDPDLLIDIPVDKSVDKPHKIKQFIDSLDKDKKNILCFSHGETLREYFQYLNTEKLKNTEIVCYNTETNQNKRIKRDEIVNIDESLENICGNPLDLGTLKSLGARLLDLQEIKMFYVINKYFNDQKYDVNDDDKVLELYKTHKDTKTVVIDEDFVDVSQLGGKYLKYKKKYMKLKNIAKSIR